MRRYCPYCDFGGEWAICTCGLAYPELADDDPDLESLEWISGFILVERIKRSWPNCAVY